MIDLSEFSSGEIITIILTIIGIVIGFTGAVLQGYIPLFHQWRSERLLTKSFGSELFTPEVIANSTRYYVRPDCSNVDPSREAEIRNVVATKEKLFSIIDQFLASDSIYRHMIILADSGMGKTSALLNYYAYNQQRRASKRYRIALIPLGIPDADERVAKIENHADTILFLDAFDEDTGAIIDHVERLRDLIDLCRDFKRIIITSRTQFFPRDAEIPEETGIIRVGPRKAGEKGVYTFQKLYLSPLSDHQVTQYLRKRYPIWQWWSRQKARKIVAQVPNLSVRPMLLSYIPDLITKQGGIRYAYELYENLIDAWLMRESAFVEPQNLRRFSELLAVNLYVNREKRGAERIPRDELKPLADKWHVRLDDWQLAGRSLLNRDAEGNFKFAHRSIMEYLFLRCDVSTVEIEWKDVVPTDQMANFIKEIVAGRAFNLLKNLPGANLERATLQGATFQAANLVGADLQGADLRVANLVGATVAVANLARATLRGANLVGANLVGANLVGANLVGANLARANLVGANLRKAKYNDDTIWPAGFDYRNSGAFGPRANLRGANVERAILEGANLRGATLEGANLEEANIRGATLAGADLRGANLARANLARANLEEANVRGATLAGADLFRANLKLASYDDATIWPDGFDPINAGAIKL
jgi:uncharacterized protein YjbI with pentapeptide repeats